MFVVGLLAGVAVGLLLTVLGAGGSIFIVPVLVFVLHEPVSRATGTSLAIVFAGAVVGAVGQWRKGNLDLKVTAWFGAAAMIGAVGSVALHPLVSERALLGVFAAGRSIQDRAKVLKDHRELRLPGCLRWGF